MRVIAKKSFIAYVGDEREKFRANEGDEFELPKDVDWIGAGLVEKVPGAVEELAKSVTKRPRRKGKADEDQD